MAGVRGKSGRKANEQIVRQNLVNILDQLCPSADRKRLINILEKLVTKAEGGDLQAIQAIMDRVDGKAKTVNEHSGPDGGDIPVSIKVEWGK